MLELLFYQFVYYSASFVNLSQEDMYSRPCPCLWFAISFQLRNEFVGLLSSLCTCGGFVEFHSTVRTVWRPLGALRMLLVTKSWGGMFRGDLSYNWASPK